MKKILAVSLVAMMAVSTARADIASTAYVTDAVAAETELREEAVDAINAELAGKQATLTTSNIKGSGSVSVAISNGVITVTGTDNNTTYSTGNASTAGLTKLYTGTGSETDGTMTQAAITTALGGKQATIGDLGTIRSGAAEGATAVQKSEVVTGATNGTISVQGTDVAVKGLGSAAYTASTAYATATQGTKADSAKGVTDAITGATQLAANTAGGTYVLTMSKDGTSGAITYKWEQIDRSYN